jgi:hypothetical protein
LGGFLEVVLTEERRVGKVLAMLKGQRVAIVDVGLKREIVKLIEKVWGHKFPI